MGMFAYTYKREKFTRDLITPCHVEIPSESGNFQTEVPQFSEYYMNALWDTGANSSAISTELVKILGLKPISTKKTLISANGEYQSNLYTIDLYLTDDVVFKNLIVSELKYNDSLQVIVGLDVILQSDFVIEPHGECYTFKFRYPAEGNQNIPVKPLLMKTYADMLKEKEHKD